MESLEAKSAKLVGESSRSNSSDFGDDKPVIVRVKRKLGQSPLEALWIEINERPFKRPLLDFQKLSIDSSSSPTKVEEEPKVKRVLVQHVETVGNSKAAVDFVNSFVETISETDDDSKFTASNKQRTRTLFTNNIRGRLLSKAKQQHQEQAKSARFEQIWKHRKQGNESIHDEALGEVCRVYDVLRVDVEDTTMQEKQEEISAEDEEALSKFLPLLREFIPTAAEEIESDFPSQASKQDLVDGYVYDLYAVTQKVDDGEASYPFPLVQLDDDDQCYDGPDDSDYETDDSNAENHPYNDYPEEESSEEEGTETSGSVSKEDESEAESDDYPICFGRSEDPMSDDELDENVSHDSNEVDDEDVGDGDGDGEDWRWSYR